MICGTFTLNHVPALELDEVVEGFEASNPPPLRVEHTPDGPGTFKVQAIFPPCAANATHSTDAAPVAAAAAAVAPVQADIVFDISHHQDPVDFAKARADGLVGVIHKATQGLGFVDSRFAARRPQALAAGLLFGAYHFGTGTDGVKQAEHFLETVQPDTKTLVALDFEGNPMGPSMTLDQARAFVGHIKAKLGRHPVLYGGHFLREALAGAADPVLSACPLWFAQYGPKPEIPKAWAAWTLWQHTDGKVGPGPRVVDGVGPCDRDRFQGDEAALRAWWAS